MHIRFITEHDVEQVVDLMYEVDGQAKYARGLKLDNPVMAKLMVASMRDPSQYPCFVSERDGVITGMLFGFVVPSFFQDHRILEERVFYIRKAYRSYRLARAFIQAVETWAKEEGIRQIELGNAFMCDPRIDTMYRKLGYDHINTTHAKRI